MNRLYLGTQTEVVGRALKTSSLHAVVLTLALILAGPAIAGDQHWFAAAPSQCDGVPRASAYLTGLGITNGPVSIQANGRHLHARAPISLLTTGTTLSNKELSDDDANSFREYLQREASNFEVPALIASLADLSFAAFPIPPAFAPGLAFSILFDSMQAKSIPMFSLAMLAAPGGVITRNALPATRNTDPYLVVVDSYEVPVGREKRTFILRSCVLPLEVLAKKFETTESPNAKLITRRSDADWEVHDIEDGKIDRIIHYVAQDTSYFYFDNKDGSKWRISFRGGPLQHLRDGSWKTLYAKVVSE